MIAGSLGFATTAHANDIDQLRKDLDDARAEIASLREMVETLTINHTGNAPAPEFVTADNKDVTDARIEELEEIVTDHDDKLGDRALVTAFDAVTFDLGGFLHATSSIVIGEDNTTASFNQQVFELLAHADLSAKWELFIAQAFIRNGPLTFTDPDGVRSPEFENNNSPVATDTVIAWGQYHHNDALNVQFGRYITPVGIINVEHFPASLLDTAQPMFLRPFSGQSLFSNFLNGVNVNGSIYTGDAGENTVEYSVFGGFFSGNATNPSLGARVRYSLGQSGLSLGANVITGDRNEDIDGDRFTTVGADILYDKGRFLFKSEAFFSNEPLGDNKRAFYVQPAFRVTPALIGFYRFDYFDDGSLADPRIEHVLGIVHNPVANVRLRALYRHNQFTDSIGVVEAATDTFQIQTTLNF